MTILAWCIAWVLDFIIGDPYSAAKHLIPICISFDTDKK